MSDTRRDFLKFVVAGSVAAGCPVNLSLLAAESGPKPLLDSDHFAICHEVRDGQQFDKPPVSSRPRQISENPCVYRSCAFSLDRGGNQRRSGFVSALQTSPQAVPQQNHANGKD